ncbi:MAG: YHS domain-containing protein [Desulfobia sp.]
MTPLRIIVLALLLFILYRLIFGPKKKKTCSRSRKGIEAAERDVLVEDPVCHSFVPKKEAIRGVKGGKTFYFCSESCARTFLEDPEDPEA